MRAGAERDASTPGTAPGDFREDVVVPCGDVVLPATLTVPREARAVVVFAHGSGSGRTSPRNRFVADAFHAAGLATLLMDMTVPGDAMEQEASSQRSQDVAILARRLAAAARWIARHATTKVLPQGVFGSSTGAAAALLAAARPMTPIRAVVCRGGRTDLAGAAIADVTVPTLLVVGGEDSWVLGINREALERLAGEKELVVVPGAGHLFEEPGALARVASAAAAWFQRHLVFGPAGTWTTTA